jgi:hypothetical protein
MTKHSKRERERRAEETERVKQIEAAWIGSLPSPRRSRRASRRRARGAPSLAGQTWRPGRSRGRHAPATSRRSRSGSRRAVDASADPDPRVMARWA